MSNIDPVVNAIYDSLAVYRAFMGVIIHPRWPVFGDVDKQYLLKKLSQLQRSPLTPNGQKANIHWLTRLIKAWCRQDLTYAEREWTALEAAPRLIALKTAVENNPAYVLLKSAGVKFDWTPAPFQ